MWTDSYTVKDIKAGLYVVLHDKEARELTDNEVNLLYFLSLDRDLQEAWNQKERREAAAKREAICKP